MVMAESDYLAMDGSIASVSYLHRGTAKCWLIGLRSTMCRYPPVLFGSNRDADTHWVGLCTGIIAPSLSSFGKRFSLQNVDSSIDHIGLLLWKLHGLEVNGSISPDLIHLRIILGAPIFAQKRKCWRTWCCRPTEGKTLSGSPGESGCHLP